VKVWVIGGTSGIGLACANTLQTAGYPVSRSGSEVDVRDGKILSAYAATEGPFYGLIYSAGINHLDWSEELDCERAAEVYDINVLGLVRALQAAEGVERVVVIGSDAAWRPMRTSLAYNASKAALHEAVRVVARERAHSSFTINVVAPGLTLPTQMTDYVMHRTKEVRGWEIDQTWDYMLAGIPMGRPADPIEVAHVVRDVFEAPPYLNGAIIPVNGGR
jgi:NAD(P)-dependent dehydrogenase (short-subunit alcohol dehydrogenase family)